MLGGLDQAKLAASLYMGACLLYTESPITGHLYHVFKLHLSKPSWKLKTLALAFPSISALSIPVSLPSPAYPFSLSFLPT